MRPVNTYYDMPPEASSQYAEMQKLYDEQIALGLVGKGTLEPIAQRIWVQNREPTLPMLVQLMGLNLQLAASLFATLKGYQISQSLQRQKGRLGSLQEQQALMGQLKTVEGAKPICDALELIIEEEKMRSHVQGEMGSLVAA